MAPPVPRAAPTGVFWERGNVDNFRNWSDAGVTASAARRSFRKYLERWVQKDGPNDALLGAIRQLLADRIGDGGRESELGFLPEDNGKFFRDAGVGDESSKFSGDPTYTGKVGQFIRLASKTHTSLQRVFTDEQQQLLYRFDNATDAVETGMTVYTVVRMCTTFLDFLGSLVARVAPDVWRQLYTLLDEIADALGAAVPGIGTQWPWINYLQSTEARKTAADVYIEDEQRKRDIEYLEQTNAEKWVDLPLVTFKSLEVGGGGECFYLSIAYLFDNETRAKVLDLDGKLNEARLRQAERFRKSVVRYMGNKEVSGGRRYRYYRQKVMEELSIDIESFIEQDCTEEFFGEKTLMQTAAQYDKVSAKYRVSYYREGDESDAQLEARRDAIYTAWLQIMNRSKFDTLKWGMQQNFDAVYAQILQEAGGVRRDLNTQGKVKRAVRERMVMTGVAFARQSVVEAMAWMLKWRITVYNFRQLWTPTQISQSKGDDQREERIAQNRRWQDNLVRAASFGRLSWSPWRGVLHTGSEKMTRMNAAGWHYQPIVVREEVAGVSDVPAGFNPGMPRQSREGVSDVEPAVTHSETGPLVEITEEEERRMAEAKQREREAKEAAEQARLAREAETERTRLAALAASKEEERLRLERERQEEARDERAEAAMKRMQLELEQKRELAAREEQKMRDRQLVEEAERARREQLAREAQAQMEKERRNNGALKNFTDKSNYDHIKAKRALQQKLLADQEAKEREAKMPKGDPPPDAPPSPPGSRGGMSPGPKKPTHEDTQKKAVRKMSAARESMKRRGLPAHCWEAESWDELTSMRAYLCRMWDKMLADDDDPIMKKKALKEDQVPPEEDEPPP